MQNSAQNGRGGTRPSRKHHNGVISALGGTTSASSGFVLQETQRNPISSVNLRALCEKRIGSSPRWGGWEEARLAVAPYPEPRKSQRRSANQRCAPPRPQTQRLTEKNPCEPPVLYGDDELLVPPEILVFERDDFFVGGRLSLRRFGHLVPPRSRF